MTTPELPVTVSELVGEEIAYYIECYAPSTLDARQWAIVRDCVCDLTARTQPCSSTDAKVVLSALCRFLAWVEPIVGTFDLDVVLIEPLIERFADELKGSLTASGRDTYRTRLRRCLRVRAGDPARTRRGLRAEEPQPYNAAERTVLETAAATSAGLNTVLVAGLQRGLVSAKGSSRNGSEAFSPAEWLQARAAAAVAGVPLSADRLRVTWSLRVLALPTAIGVVIAREGISRRDLDKALPHFAPHDLDEYRRSLRG